MTSSEFNFTRYFSNMSRWNEIISRYSRLWPEKKHFVEHFFVVESANSPTENTEFVSKEIKRDFSHFPKSFYLIWINILEYMEKLTLWISKFVLTILDFLLLAANDFAHVFLSRSVLDVNVFKFFYLWNEKTREWDFMESQWGLATVNKRANIPKQKKNIFLSIWFD